MTKRDIRYSDFDLQRDSKTVLYEFKTMHQIATNLNRKDVRQDPTSSNAHIESFGIHCRAIIVFLFGHDGTLHFHIHKKGDVLAVDFFRDDQTRWEPKIEPHLLAAKNQADKQIAHITTERRGLDQSPDQKVWRIREILHSLSKAMEQFLNEVPKTRLADGVEAQLGELVQKALMETDSRSTDIPLGAATGPTAMTFSCLVVNPELDDLPDLLRRTIGTTK